MSLYFMERVTCCLEADGTVKGWLLCRSPTSGDLTRSRSGELYGTTSLTLATLC